MIEAESATATPFHVAVTGAGTRRTSLHCVDVRTIVYSAGPVLGPELGCGATAEAVYWLSHSFVLIEEKIWGKNGKGQELKAFWVGSGFEKMLGSNEKGQEMKAVWVGSGGEGSGEVVFCAGLSCCNLSN